MEWHQIGQVAFRHRKRILLYSIGFVVLLILIFANIKIIHLNDNLEISYCAGYNYKNLPPPCQKLLDEAKQYNLYSALSWGDIWKRLIPTQKDTIGNTFIPTEKEPIDNRLLENK